MKTIGKLSFGLTAVVSGQKSSVINAEPTLTANSTAGKFTITPPVSKALGVASGEYIQFYNNIPSVEAAIVDRNEDLIAWCKEQGLDIESYEGQQAIMKEFVCWYIGKGVQQFDSKGNPKMVSERYSKEDKEKFLKDNIEAIVEQNREALIVRVGNPDATFEELAASVTVDDIESPKTEAYSGSKAVNVSGLTGIGVQLTFTDSATWNQIKASLGDDKDKMNRIFKVLLDEADMVECNNGKETVQVRVLPLEFFEDVAPVQRTKKEATVAE